MATLMQRRTLEDFPMEHTLQDARQMLKERRHMQAEQQQHFIYTTGECKKLSSYSRQRFECALASNDDIHSLTPRSSEDGSVCWAGPKPSWMDRRTQSVSTAPVADLVQLTLRPASGPSGGSVAKSLRVFNHQRGNNNAYPTIRRILRERNNGYRVECPSPAKPPEIHGRPPTAQSIHDKCLLVPLEDMESSSDDGDKGECGEMARQEEKEVELNEQQLSAEMIQMAESEFSTRESEIKEQRMSKVISEERKESPRRESTKKESPRKKISPGLKTRKKSSTTQKVDISEEASKPDVKKEKEEEEPASPWHCWVDDATITSSVRSDQELPAPDETSPISSPTPEEQDGMKLAQESEEEHQNILAETSRSNLGMGPSKTSIKQTDPLVDKRKPARKPSVTSGKKGDKRAIQEPEVEKVESPPQAAPPIEEVEEVEDDPIPEPVLPSYICPSSVEKSNQAEIKLWLRKSSFSGANRFPNKIY